MSTEQQPGREYPVEVTPEMRQKVGEMVEVATSNFCIHAQRLVDKGEITEREVTAVLRGGFHGDFEDAWVEWMEESGY